MPRFITLKIDLDDLPRLVEESARVCLAAHKMSLPPEWLKEVGNNVAGAIVVVGDLEHTTDRLDLWAHIVSEHCNAAPPGSVSEMMEYHEHEHEGPGTIRNHDPNSFHYSLKKLVKVLSEVEDEEDEYKGSFCEAADNEGHRICAASREGSDD
jgi:hypothetical protein